MFCSNCGAELAANAKFCSGCGRAVNSQAAPKKPNVVSITFPIVRGQIFNLGCHIYRDGKEIASGKQGDTVSFQCDIPFEIEVKVNGAFGKARGAAIPGEKYKVSLRGIGTIFLSKVDEITGPTLF
jgi:hypothetical protein